MRLFKSRGKQEKKKQKRNYSKSSGLRFIHLPTALTFKCIYLMEDLVFYSLVWLIRG